MLRLTSSRSAFQARGNSTRLSLAQRGSAGLFLRIFVSPSQCATLVRSGDIYANCLNPHRRRYFNYGLLRPEQGGGGQECHRARDERSDAGLEPPRSGRLYAGLLEVSGAHVLFGSAGSAWLAGHTGTLPQALSERRERDGCFAVFRSADRAAWHGCRVCSRQVETNPGRWEDAERPIYADLPQAARRLEDCARPYIGERVNSRF